MITTFFGAHSFGGDAAYVDRLSRALLRRGHEVHVVYSLDAFEAVRGRTWLRPYELPEGLVVHPLKFGPLAPLWVHQTGTPGKAGAALGRLLCEHQFDVLHFHNLSLVGGLGLLSRNETGQQPLKLLTAHEHWLICPLSSLWKFDREICENPQCVPCMISAWRPPQLWRATHLRNRSLESADALIFPSRHALETHANRGVRHHRVVKLPYFLPDDWAGKVQSSNEFPGRSGRPFFVAVGRLVKEKGFQELIPKMRSVPEADLFVAGSGPYEGELRRLARTLQNVHFLGYLGYPDLARLYSGARAVVMPSLFYETFGYVALEAHSVGTPAIVRNRGALPELIEASGAGQTFETETELLAALRRFASDEDLSRALGAKGLQALNTLWSEERHMQRYLDLIGSLRD